MATATEKFSSYLLDSNSNPVFVRVFDVDLPPQTALNPALVPTLPTYGDAYPDDTSLKVDAQRIIDRLSTNLTRVAVRYSRITFEGVNVVRTDSNPSGPFVVTQYSSLNETISVPRYMQIVKDIVPVGGGAPVPTTVEYQQRTQNIPISSTLITKTLHRDEWTAGDQAAVDEEIGKIHADLGNVTAPGEEYPSQARFLGADVQQVGLHLWRVVYRWKLAYPYGPFLVQPVVTGGVDFTANLIGVFNANSPGGGSFPPHSLVVPVVSSTSTIANIGADSQPLYVAELIYTGSGLSTALPGLA